MENPNARRIPFALVSLWLLAACRPELAPRGRELVRETLPELDQAFVETVGEATTERLFAHWGPTDIAFFRLKNHALLEHFLTDAPIPSVARLFASRGANAVSTFGEVFGIAHFGVAPRPRGAWFYDEVGYDAYNAAGRRPDGLLVQVERDRLVLHQVFESKIGTSGFDTDQSRKYLGIWKTRGMVLPVKGVTHPFSPKQIFLRDRQGGLHPIGTVDQPFLEAHTTLVATRAHPEFAGTVLRLPCTAVQAQEAALRWIELLARDRPVEQRHENFVVPALETADEVHDYRTSLRDFLVEKGRWPKTTGAAGVELFLAREISRRRGQVRAFVEDLDDATRALLASRRIVPAMHPFERRLLEMSPRDPGALSALAAYRLAIEDDAEPSPIVGLLATRGRFAAEWRSLVGLPPAPPPPTCGPSLAEEDDTPR